MKKQICFRTKPGIIKDFIFPKIFSLTKPAIPDFSKKRFRPGGGPPEKEVIYERILARRHNWCEFMW